MADAVELLHRSLTRDLAIGVASGSYPDLRQTPLRDEFLQET